MKKGVKKIVIDGVRCVFYKKNGTWYCKNDGRLTNRSLNIFSAGKTLKEAKENMKKWIARTQELKVILKNIKKFKFHEVKIRR